MPRPRKKENQGLPTRWKLHHGAYYYLVPSGLEAAWDGKKKFRLGATLPEAYSAWAERVGRIDKIRTVSQLLDQYAMEVIPTKSPTTQTQNIAALKPLRENLGTAPLTSLKPPIIYGYVRHRGKTAKVGAMREIEVLSHALTKAVEWGYIDVHPFAWQLRFENESPRDRYIEDWELEECLSLKSRRKKGSVSAAQAYIRIKRITGMARGDLLRLRPSIDFGDEGIQIQRHKTAKKTGKRTLYLWTDELRGAVADAIAARPVDISPWLFCNLRGECYFDEETGRAGGWESLWRNFMARVLKETKVTERFTEHDIRAKTASDADTLEHAQALLSHADSRTTKRIYRRKAERVKPLR
ncbi:integrase [Paraburkholderia sediminicola]|uniref:integrase n=1 Tax=Paraburkholderia sediminicola TaxID=458836 RepID=UPI0038BC1C23